MSVPEGFKTWSEFAFYAAMRSRANEFDVSAMRSRPFDPGEDCLEELRYRLWVDAQGRGARIQDIRVYILARDLLRCRICNVDIRSGMQTIDHILPICMGGGNDPDNLRVVHPFCNNSRGPHGRRGRPRILHPDAYVKQSYLASIRCRFRNVLDALPATLVSHLKSADEYLARSET